MSIEYAKKYIFASVLISIANILISVGGLVLSWNSRGFLDNTVILGLIVLMMGFTYGVSKKNVICAIGICVIYAISLISIIIFLHGMGLVWGFLSLCCGYIGIKGTSFYNKNKV